MKKNWRLNKGFTLIEILLVIAIIGIVATITLTSYQRQTMNFKVEKTALEMQEIMQAAANYYRDWGTWPYTKNGGFNNYMEAYFVPYLPVATTGSGVYLYSPWTVGTSNMTYWIDTTDVNKFKVQIQVPSMTIGRRIAGLLPYGYAWETSGKYYIYAYLPAPNQQGSANGLLIKDVGTRKDNNTATPVTITCPPNFTGNVEAVPNDLNAYDPVSPYGYYYVYRLRAYKMDANSNALNTNCTRGGTDSKGNSYWNCPVSTHYESRASFSGFGFETRKAGTMGFTYVAFCFPNVYSP